MSVRLARRASTAAIFLIALAAPGIAHAFTPTPFSPVVEAQNFSKVEERQAIYDTPDYQVLLRTVSAMNAAAADAEQVNDPAREFADHVCRSGEDGCAGDARLYRWQTSGAEPVFRNRLRAARGAIRPAAADRRRPPPASPASWSRRRRGSRKRRTAGGGCRARCRDPVRC